MALAVVAGVAGVAAGCGSGADGPVLARAAGLELTVDDAARLLADYPAIPNQPAVVELIAELWVDYALVAKAVQEDSLLNQVDLEPVVRQQLEQIEIRTLFDQEVQADTTFTEEEVRGLFRTEAPGLTVSARHILLTYPEGATQAQRDSVVALARDLRARIEGGEDFQALAREYSQDTQTAAAGGDLGAVTRGRLLPPVDSATFALEVGEVSDPVESIYGIHLVQVYDRTEPDFETQGESFRQTLIAEAVQRAESTYIAGLLSEGEPELSEGAIDATREIARRPGQSLGGRAAARTLVSHSAESLTAAELQTWVRAQSPQVRQQMVQAPDEAIGDFLRDLLQLEAVRAEIREGGVVAAESTADSIRQEMRQILRDIAGQMGVSEVTPRAGETREGALQRVVRQGVTDVLAQRRTMVPLGAVSYVLRDDYGARVYDGQIARTVELAQELRTNAGTNQPQAFPTPGRGGGAGGAPPQGGPPPGQGTPPPAAGDTSSSG